MSLFSGLFSWLLGIFQQVAYTLTGKIAASLIEIAQVAVAEVEAGNLASAEKRAAAYFKILAKAAEEGKEFTASAINLAIEMAVALLKDATEKGDE